MKKEILLSTAAVMGTAIVGANAQSVQADNVNDNGNVAVIQQQPTNDKKTAQADLGQAKEQQAQAQTDLNKAQNDLDDAKADEQVAADNVHKAQGDVDQAQELKNEATPENIEQVKDSIKDQEKNIAEVSNNMRPFPPWRAFHFPEST